MKVNFLFLFCLFFTVSFSVKSDLLSATNEYNVGNYQGAYDEFQRLAKLGNKDAIYNIGVMYLHGQGVEKNLVNAHSWFNLAADFGLDEARSAAQLIKQQIKQPELLQSSFQKLNQSYSFDNYSKTLLPIFNEQKFHQSTSQPPLRIHTVDAKYPKSAYEKGLEGWVWLEFDVDESGAVKDVDIIDAFPDKTFNRSIYNAVRRWRYEPFSIEGKPGVYSSRSLLYHFTTFKGERYKASFASQKKEYQKKINQLIEGAEQGNALVQYYIANWMNAEEHNATRLLRFHWQQANASSELLLSSAVNGFPNSQYRLGANLLRGEYTEEDRKKGLNWILYAAQSGFVFAQYRLARELLDKRFVEYEPKKAMRWMTTSAEQGHFRAMRDLVNIFVEAQDFSAAQHWLVKALKEDDEHPDLLFAQAKIQLHNDNKISAKKTLKKAIKSAKQRDWYLDKLEQYLSVNF